MHRIAGFVDVAPRLDEVIVVCRRRCLLRLGRCELIGRCCGGEYGRQAEHGSQDEVPVHAFPHVSSALPCMRWHLLLAPSQLGRPKRHFTYWL